MFQTFPSTLGLFPARRNRRNRHHRSSSCNASINAGTINAWMMSLEPKRFSPCRSVATNGGSDGSFIYPLVIQVLHWKEWWCLVARWYQHQLVKTALGCTTVPFVIEVHGNWVCLDRIIWCLLRPMMTHVDSWKASSITVGRYFSP